MHRRVDRPLAESGNGTRIEKRECAAARGALEEQTVPHQVFVAEFLGVIAPPGLDSLGNEAEEGVADIPRAGIEVGGADIGVLELDVLSDRHLLDPCVDDDNLSSCLPDRGAGSAGSSEVATRLARTCRRDDHCVNAPVEGERDEVRLPGNAGSRDPDVDLRLQKLEGVFDSLIARSGHRVIIPLRTRPEDARLAADAAGAERSCVEADLFECVSERFDVGVGEVLGKVSLDSVSVMAARAL